MTILTSGLGGGGGFTPKFVSGLLSIPAASSGDLITITPPSGQKVRITGLTSDSFDDGITITAAGVTVLDSLQLSNQSGKTAGSFTIGAPRGSIDSCSDILHFDFDAGEEVKVIKDTGNTSNIMYYAYQFGE